MAVENRTKEIEKCLREIKEDLEEYKRKECKRGGDEESIGGISYKSNSSRYRNSVVNSKWGSEGSLSGKGSCLSEREIDIPRKIVKKKDKTERNNNIVLKDIDLEKEEKIDI